MHRDHITVLDTEVVPHDTVDTCTPIIKVVIRKNNQNGILAHFTLDQNRIATEELQRLHGIVGESDNRVVIVDCIGDTVIKRVSTRRLIG